MTRPTGRAVEEFTHGCSLQTHTAEFLARRSDPAHYHTEVDKRSRSLPTSAVKRSPAQSSVLH
ncbi:hypothetical protein EYF80_036869 [Liparis tanakae]|uniref:Uncharacterized protein n=1 Tax=Liparis tanakae TaxID=230148 RepID=A0A4Z2GIB3_9TELE|nr:hypothetical protein EYF80_036869 [Liparis tanakae]